MKARPVGSTDAFLPCTSSAGPGVIVLDRTGIRYSLDGDSHPYPYRHQDLEFQCDHPSTEAFSTRWTDGVRCADCEAVVSSTPNLEERRRATDGIMSHQLSGGNQERARLRDQTHEPLVDQIAIAMRHGDDEEIDENDICF